MTIFPSIRTLSSRMLFVILLIILTIWLEGCGGGLTIVRAEEETDPSWLETRHIPSPPAEPEKPPAEPEKPR